MRFVFRNHCSINDGAEGERLYSWAGRTVKILSGTTVLLSRACLFLFGEYMLMSNQLYHREAKPKGTIQ